MQHHMPIDPGGTSPGQTSFLTAAPIAAAASPAGGGASASTSASAVSAGSQQQQQQQQQQQNRDNSAQLEFLANVVRLLRLGQKQVTVCRDALEKLARLLGATIPGARCQPFVSSVALQHQHHEDAAAGNNSSSSSSSAMASSGAPAGFGGTAESSPTATFSFTFATGDGRDVYFSFSASTAFAQQLQQQSAALPPQFAKLSQSEVRALRRHFHSNALGGPGAVLTALQVNGTDLSVAEMCLAIMVATLAAPAPIATILREQLSKQNQPQQVVATHRFQSQHPFAHVIAAASAASESASPIIANRIKGRPRMALRKLVKKWTKKNGTRLVFAILVRHFDSAVPAAYLRGIVLPVCRLVHALLLGDPKCAATARLSGALQVFCRIVLSFPAIPSISLEALATILATVASLCNVKLSLAALTRNGLGVAPILALIRSLLLSQQAPGGGGGGGGSSSSSSSRQQALFYATLNNLHAHNVARWCFRLVYFHCIIDSSNIRVALEHQVVEVCLAVLEKCVSTTSSSYEGGIVSTALHCVILDLLTLLLYGTASPGSAEIQQLQQQENKQNRRNNIVPLHMEKEIIRLVARAALSPAIQNPLEIIQLYNHLTKFLGMTELPIGVDGELGWSPTNGCPSALINKDGGGSSSDDDSDDDKDGDDIFAKLTTDEQDAITEAEESLARRVSLLSPELESGPSFRVARETLFNFAEARARAKKVHYAVPASSSTGAGGADENSSNLHQRSSSSSSAAGLPPQSQLGVGGTPPPSPPLWSSVGAETVMPVETVPDDPLPDRVYLTLARNLFLRLVDPQAAVAQVVFDNVARSRALPRAYSVPPMKSSSSSSLTAESAAAPFAPTRPGGATSSSPSSSPSYSPSFSAPLFATPQLVFDSAFECGNLKRVIRTGEADYDIVLTGDTNTARQGHWFYFSVRNMVVGVQYCFRFINFDRPGSTFGVGNRLLMYSEKLFDECGTGWLRAGEEIAYFKNSFVKPGGGGDGGDRNSSATPNTPSSAMMTPQTSFSSPVDFSPTGSPASGGFAAAAAGGGAMAYSNLDDPQPSTPSSSFSTTTTKGGAGKKRTGPSGKKAPSSQQQSDDDAGAGGGTATPTTRRIRTSVISRSARGGGGANNDNQQDQNEHGSDQQQQQTSSKGKKSSSSSSTGGGGGGAGGAGGGGTSDSTTYDDDYKKKEVTVQSLIANKATLNTLHVTMRFPYTQDRVFLCPAYPYAYSDLINYIEQLPTSPDCVETMSPSLMVQELCQTDAGLPVPVLTITALEHDDGSPVSAAEMASRPVCVVSARVHPGEVVSSFVAKGVVDYLLDPVNPVSRALRHGTVWKIIPCLNPDGVVHGHYRTDLHGFDLNRMFLQPLAIKTPTVAALNQLFRHIRSQGRRVVLYGDFHGHSKRTGCFTYGCGSTRRAVHGAIVESIFPAVLHSLCPVFDPEGCTYRVMQSKIATGRVVAYRAHEIRMAYTLEVSLMGGHRFAPVSTGEDEEIIERDAVRGFVPDAGGGEQQQAQQQVQSQQQQQQQQLQQPQLNPDFAGPELVLNTPQSLAAIGAMFAKAFYCVAENYLSVKAEDLFRICSEPRYEIQAMPRRGLVAETAAALLISRAAQERLKRTARAGELAAKKRAQKAVGGVTAGGGGVTGSSSSSGGGGGTSSSSSTSIAGGGATASSSGAALAASSSSSSSSTTAAQAAAQQLQLQQQEQRRLLMQHDYPHTSLIVGPPVSAQQSQDVLAALFPKFSQAASNREAIIASLMSSIDYQGGGSENTTSNSGGGGGGGGGGGASGGGGGKGGKGGGKTGGAGGGGAKKRSTSMQMSRASSSGSTSSFAGGGGGDSKLDNMHITVAWGGKLKEAGTLVSTTTMMAPSAAHGGVSSPLNVITLNLNTPLWETTVSPGGLILANPSATSSRSGKGGGLLGGQAGRGGGGGGDDDGGDDAGLDDGVDVESSSSEDDDTNDEQMMMLAAMASNGPDDEENEQTAVPPSSVVAYHDNGGDDENGDDADGDDRDQQQDQVSAATSSAPRRSSVVSNASGASSSSAGSASSASQTNETPPQRQPAQQQQQQQLQRPPVPPVPVLRRRGSGNARSFAGPMSNTRNRQQLNEGKK